MMFDNPLLNAAFEENKSYLENRLKVLEETNRDIQQIETNLKNLSTPPYQRNIEGIGIVRWDGKYLKLENKKLILCADDVKLKISPHLLDFLKFVLKGEN
jgi:hypothetical protein